MRLLTTILFLFLVQFAQANVYYVSATGSDGNPGTFASPKFTLNSVWSSLSAGDTVYMRGGRYVYTVQQYLTGKNGTSADTIRILAYPGESPVITRGASFNKSAGHHRGMVFFTGNYFHWRGIRFTGMYTSDDQVDDGFLPYDANYNKFERLVCDSNVHGMYMQGSCTGNWILNCDFANNYSNYGGSNGSNSDGLALAYMSGTSTNNTVEGCRFWNNGDDGMDTFENLGFVTVKNCWAWHNGYLYGSSTDAGDGVGFKIGSDFTAPQTNILKRRYQNCMAWDNANAGMHINEAEYKTEIFNCTFYDNGEQNFNFHYTNRNHSFKNVVSFGSPWDVARGSNSTSDSCSYGVSGYADVTTGWRNNASTADFVSVSWTGADGARQSDGSLPEIDFLKLAAGSDLINTGTVISGISYNESAPDRGAREYGTASNASPSANAGTDQSITLPTSSVTLSGSGTDSDGTISGYAWTKVSGTGGTIVSPSSASTSVTGLTAGTYVFRLTVTDNNSATGTDDVTITVNSASSNPPANGFKIRGRRIIFLNQ